MGIKVLIKRKVVENNLNEINQLLIQLRALAMKQEGYLSGETLKRVDSPGEYLVISSWKSLDHWSRWLVSNERREFQERIDSLIGTETKFEIYEQ